MKKIVLMLLCVCMMLAACTPSPAPQPVESSAPGTEPAQSNAPQQTEKMQLNILNWGDYMDEDVLADFRSEYPNISVVYDTTASNEEMLVQLESESSIYDICFPSEYMIEKMLGMNLLSEIDHSKISNLGNIDERFMNQSYDPGNKYSIPYMWGTVGILYNTDMVFEEVDNWSILWDERYKKQILMYDSIRDSIGITLKRLGYSMNTRDASHIEEAEKALIDQKPLVLAYGTDDIKDKMIGESAALGVVYSGDAVMCIEENPVLAYAVPQEGSNIWFDSAVILERSKNKEAAHIFIDFLCRADIAMRNTLYLGYSTPNKAALELLDDERKNDETYNPPQDVIDRCEVFGDLGDFVSVYNDSWMRVKAAH